MAMSVLPTTRCQGEKTWGKWNRVIATVDGSEIPNNHRLDVQNLVNDGIFSILTGA